MNATDRPITDRAKEPSTYVGIFAVIAGIFFGTKHPEINDPTFWGAVTATISGIFNILMREKK
jgi:hypothetical protein